MFYGGRSVLSESQDSLTSAQEEVLYREGTIPPARVAEAMLAKQPAPQPPVRAGRAPVESSIGHKWPLPQRPFPDDHHHRQRYHPVLHQISRLLMRDGKLSAAQKVCNSRVGNFRGCMELITDFIEFGNGHESLANVSSTYLQP